MDKPIKGFSFAERGTSWYEDRIIELEAMLRKHEWDSGREFDECPECNESFAHTDDCRLNKLLNNK